MADKKDVLQEGGWISRMLELYDAGRSDEEVCRELEITMKQFEDYRNKSKAFCDLVDRGRDYSKAWWMRFTREAAMKKVESSPDLVKFNLVNRHGWGSKSEIKPDAVTLDRGKVEDELRKLMPDLTERLSRGETLQDLSRKALRESTAKH